MTIQVRNSYVQTEGLIADIRIKNARLYQILKNLNEDLRSNREAQNVVYTPGSNSPVELKVASAEGGGGLTLSEVLELVVSLIPEIPDLSDFVTHDELDAAIDAVTPPPSPTVAATITFRDSSGDVGTRAAILFEEGDNVQINMTDNPDVNEVKVKISADPVPLKLEQSIYYPDDLNLLIHLIDGGFNG